MPQLFDIKTILLTAVLVNLIIAALLTVYWKRQQTYPGFGFWAASHAIGSAAYLLYALRGTIPDIISIVAANTLAIVFSTLRLEGIRLFVKGTWRRKNLVIYPLLISPLLFYFGYFVDDILIRTVIINLFLAVVAAQMLYILAGKARQTGNGIYWAPFFFFSAFVGILLLRLGIWLFDPELRGLFAASTANNTFFLIILLHDVGIAVSYLMINNKRQTDELRQAQVELQQLNADLHLRVREETERRLLQERLLAHNARRVAMGEMLGVIAHQWRQPLSTLAIIIQRLDLLHRQKILSDREMAEARATSLGQIRHLSETIDEFRRYYQPDRAGEPFSPTEACHSAAKLMRPQLDANSIHLIEQIDFPVERSLSGYSNQFKQVILNLLVNARDAILERRRREEGGPAGTIELHLDLSDNACRIRVADDGCGIAPEARAHIYEPFYTTRVSADGTGIGLYLTRTIVTDGFRGTIEFESHPGRTIFTITLPLPEQGAMDACA